MRSRIPTFAILLALLLPIACAAPDRSSDPIALPPTQIGWQRSLDDAKRLAEVTGRPLFVAINMDGESASERIVRESYRDPGFVAQTRGCVCVVGSLFRHSPRDHDEDGRRIPCPRLGSVTCGEHIALEPLLYEMLGGERVAPRHAFVRLDGTKVFDESLLFDMRDLDRMLAEALRGQNDEPHAGTDGDSFDAVTRAPNAAARARLEQRLSVAPDAAFLSGQLDAIRRTGDSGWCDALRIALHRIPELGSSTTLDAQLIATARDIGAAAPLAQTIRDVLTSVDSVPAEGRLLLRRPGDARLLELLSALDPDGAQTRSWLIGRSVVDDVTSLPSGDADVRAALSEAGGGLDLEALLNLADQMSRSERGAVPRPGPPTDALPSLDDSIARLDALEKKLLGARDDPDRHGAIAQATLDLARQRIVAGASEVPLLLEDAAREFRIALAARPERADWWIDAARTAYLQSDFARESEFGRRAWAAKTGDRSLPSESSLSSRAAAFQDPLAIDALRWIGDAEARLATSRGEASAAVQVRGLLTSLRALGLVAASPFGTAADWIGLVSLLESFGLVRAALEANLCAAERFPADADIRQSLRSILWSIGRIELEPAAAQRVARRHPDDGSAAWFVGYAHVLAAEDARRAERPAAAIAAYESAEQAFATAGDRDGNLTETCAYYIGVSWLGRGMAHLLWVRQPAAAEALVAAARSGAAVRTAVDGLQRDVFDLVDQSLEWRAGRPSPVDAIALLDRLEQADPGTAFWAGAVSDTMLREALRADGKNPERVERETVDAAGEKIRIPMGLPTELGDSYLAMAITAGRRATGHGDADPKPLAQALTIAAERELERLSNGAGDAETRLELARRSLREAAALSGVPSPDASGDRESLAATAAALRSVLGPARPRFREGR